MIILSCKITLTILSFESKIAISAVRTKSESSDIIVSGGKGIAENIEKLEELAKFLMLKSVHQKVLLT